MPTAVRPTIRRKVTSLTLLTIRQTSILCYCSYMVLPHRTQVYLPINQKDIHRALIIVREVDDKNTLKEMDIAIDAALVGRRARGVL